jgi:hypothetical protein
VAIVYRDFVALGIFTQFSNSEKVEVPAEIGFSQRYHCWVVVGVGFADQDPGANVTTPPLTREPEIFGADFNAGAVAFGTRTDFTVEKVEPILFLAWVNTVRCLLWSASVTL